MAGSGRSDGSRQPEHRPLSTFMCQPVERVRRLVHHINTRAAVNVNIDVSRAKQVGVASSYAGGNRFDCGDDPASIRS